MRKSNEVKHRELIAAQWLAEGKGYNQCIRQLRLDMNISEASAAKAIRVAYKLLELGSDEHLEKLRTININRLETIINDTMKASDAKSKDVAVRAIAELNKLSGAYGLTTDAKSTQEIVFKFGGESDVGKEK